MPTYSRRSVLFGFGAAVGLASLPRHAFAALDGTPFTFLTDSEARSLALLCDTLIPQDDFPSASQAGVVDFIDLQLAGGYGRGEATNLPYAPPSSGARGWQRCRPSSARLTANPNPRSTS